MLTQWRIRIQQRLEFLLVLFQRCRRCVFQSKKRLIRHSKVRKRVFSCLKIGQVDFLEKKYCKILAEITFLFLILKYYLSKYLILITSNSCRSITNPLSSSFSASSRYSSYELLDSKNQPKIAEIKIRTRLSQTPGHV